MGFHHEINLLLDVCFEKCGSRIPLPLPYICQHADVLKHLKHASDDVLKHASDEHRRKVGEQLELACSRGILERTCLYNIDPHAYIVMSYFEEEKTKDANAWQASFSKPPSLKELTAAGFYQEWFEPELPRMLEHYICSICREVCNNAMELECVPLGLNKAKMKKGHAGHDIYDVCVHLFCDTCIHTWKNTKHGINNFTCPVCQRIILNIRPALRDQFRIGSLQCKCINDGCDWIGEFGIQGKMFATHNKSCKWRSVTCFDCGVKLPWHGAKNHIENECVNRYVKCQQCCMYTRPSMIKKHVCIVDLMKQIAVSSNITSNPVNIGSSTSTSTSSNKVNIPVNPNLKHFVLPKIPEMLPLHFQTNYDYYNTLMRLAFMPDNARFAQDHWIQVFHPKLATTFRIEYLAYIERCEVKYTKIAGIKGFVSKSVFDIKTFEEELRDKREKDIREYIDDCLEDLTLLGDMSLIEDLIMSHLRGFLFSDPSQTIANQFTGKAQYYKMINIVRHSSDKLDSTNASIHYIMTQFLLTSSIYGDATDLLDLCIFVLRRNLLPFKFMSADDTSPTTTSDKACTQVHHCFRSIIAHPVLMRAIHNTLLLVYVLCHNYRLARRAATTGLLSALELFPVVLHDDEANDNWFIFARESQSPYAEYEGVSNILTVINRIRKVIKYQTFRETCRYDKSCNIYCDGHVSTLDSMGMLTMKRCADFGCCKPCHPQCVFSWPPYEESMPSSTSTAAVATMHNIFTECSTMSTNSMTECISSEAYDEKQKLSSIALFYDVCCHSLCVDIAAASAMQCIEDKGCMGKNHQCLLGKDTFNNSLFTRKPRIGKNGVRSVDKNASGSVSPKGTGKSNRSRSNNNKDRIKEKQLTDKVVVVSSDPPSASPLLVQSYVPFANAAPFYVHDPSINTDVKKTSNVNNTSRLLAAVDRVNSASEFLAVDDADASIPAHIVSPMHMPSSTSIDELEATEVDVMNQLDRLGISENEAKEIRIKHFNEALHRANGIEIEENSISTDDYQHKYEEEENAVCDADAVASVPISRTDTIPLVINGVTTPITVVRRHAVADVVVASDSVADESSSFSSVFPSTSTQPFNINTSPFNIGRSKGKQTKATKKQRNK